jgi:CheY-like chemotaxis protein
MYFKSINAKDGLSLPPRKVPGKKGTNFMAAAILIVGNDPILSETRAALLTGWRVRVSNSRGALESIRSTAADLIIFCQTISDETARQLLDRARDLNPNVLALAITHFGKKRSLEAVLYDVQFEDPGRFQAAVANLLQSSN